MATQHSLPTHPHFKDLTGRTFAMLRVLHLGGRMKCGKPLWLCQCECGRHCHNSTSALTRAQYPVRSCGCARKRLIGEKARRHGHTAGGKTSPEYRIWASVIRQCANAKDPAFHDYGGRGITVCPRWLGRGGFANFLADVGPRPGKHLTLERKDNGRGYEPGNCVWETRKAQGNNKRNNRRLTWNGRTMTASQWAEETGLPYSAIICRLRRGWNDEDALSVPPRRADSASDGEKLRAVWAVSYAVRKGRLPRVATRKCERCGEPATGYHHHKGYGREHRLDVVPLCTHCHRRAESMRSA